LSVRAQFVAALTDEQPRILTEHDVAERHAAVSAGIVAFLPQLRAFSQSLAKNRHQAEDLMQTAIQRALGASHQFTPGTNFKAWSFTILRNAFYNRWRTSELRDVALDDGTTNYIPSVAATQEATLEVCDLRRALAQLGGDQRQALFLVAVSGLEYEAAGRICGVAKGTMKSRVSRARGNLRALMNGGSLKLRRNKLKPISALGIASALRG
jgi:RNA polymerase sigma-70 factor (ECF subfamily)